MLSKAKFYRGIEFISVSELSDDQQLLLFNSRNPERIKIMVDEKILTNCIQYKEYCQWYSTVFERSISSVKAEPMQEKVSLVKIALSQA